MSATAARLTLIRASNDSAADAPAGIIAFAAELPDDIEVDARQVTSVQPDCLESLIAAARERAQHGSPGLCW